MLGTIEELEKEIEQFQNNMAASGEMAKLLQQILEQIQNQNAAFETESEALLARVKSLPDNIENANISSNENIRKNVETELKAALSEFSKEQNKYIVLLGQVTQQIQNQNELSSRCAKQFSESADRVAAKTDAVPEQIRKDSQEMQRTLVADVDRVLESRNNHFSDVQKQYVDAIQKSTSKTEDLEKQINQSANQIAAKTEAVPEQIKKDNQEMQNSLVADVDRVLESRNNQSSEVQKQYVDAIQRSTSKTENLMKQINDSVDRIVAKTESVTDQIKKNNQEMQNSLVTDVDRVLESRNIQLAEEQKRYIEAIQAATTKMERCQSELFSKYQEFLQTLENTNLAHLHDENQYLKSELDKRTTILMVISGMSVAVGIIGLFL